MLLRRKIGINNGLVSSFNNRGFNNRRLLGDAQRKHENASGKRQRNEGFPREALRTRGKIPSNDAALSREKRGTIAQLVRAADS